MNVVATLRTTLDKTATISSRSTTVYHSGSPPHTVLWTAVIRSCLLERWWQMMKSCVWRVLHHLCTKGRAKPCVRELVCGVCATLVRCSIESENTSVCTVSSHSVAARTLRLLAMYSSVSRCAAHCPNYARLRISCVSSAQVNLAEKVVRLANTGQV